MLPVLVFAALAAASPSPSPAPSASPGALTVIATVHASTACAEIATHANAAIAAALSNDTSLVATIKALRTTELDGNVIKHRNGLDALGEYAKLIDAQAISGDGEVKRLRALAAKSVDPARKKELKAFADWLGGAIWRQHKIARNLNGFLATMDFYDMSNLDESEQNMDYSVFGVADQRPLFIGELQPTNPISTTPATRGTGLGFQPRASERMTYDQMEQAAAREYQLEIPAINNDEAMAASHVTAAMAGC